LHSRTPRVPRAGVADNRIRHIAPLARKPGTGILMRLPHRLILCALLGVSIGALCAPAAAPVRQLAIFISPVYLAGATFGAPPRVAVDPAWDATLESTDPAVIGKARDAIAAHPELVKPETMMVLAIRLYDVGLRDDGVFWYYAGRDRFLTMEAVLDMRSIRLARQAETMVSFVSTLAEPFDGYAFCDLDHHQEREDRAIAWVAAHPYKVLGYEDLPAQSEDRNAALADAVKKLREISAHGAALMAQPEMRAQLAAARAQSQADARYCWK
jgi:hypothetical protein